MRHNIAYKYIHQCFPCFFNQTFTNGICPWSNLNHFSRHIFSVGVWGSFEISAKYPHLLDITCIYFIVLIYFYIADNSFFLRFMIFFYLLISLLRLTFLYHILLYVITPLLIWYLFFFLQIAATYVSLAFNIDMTKPVVYIGEQNDFFGYKVLQYSSGTNKG